MKLDFEKWFSVQDFISEADELFLEAIKCYKASAYRASLLFSYLAFLTIIRDRILSSPKPQALTDRQWNLILENLKNDEKWDSVVFDSTQMKSPKAVFIITDDLRNQVVYWKNRRNDCAHSKPNIITYSHVETFWQFVISNLPKFVVEGSMPGLVNDIVTHFDRSQTPLGADYSFLISRIPESVDNSDLTNFFNSVYQIFEDIGDHVFDTFAPKEIRFFRDILSINNDAVRAALLAFLRDQPNLLLEILRIDPSKIQYFADDDRFIRNLWYEQLFSKFAENYFGLYAALLRNNLIPDNQIQEANSRVISRIYAVSPSEAEFETLVENGFLEAYQREVFEPNRISDFNWANSNTAMIIKVLDQIELDEVVLNSLHGTFSQENHPWDLRRDLNSHLLANEIQANRLRDAFNDCGLPIPRYLDSLMPIPDEDEIPF